MTTVTFQPVDELVPALWLQKLNIGDTYKAAITNTAMTKAGSKVLADITPISSAGGYAAVTLTGVALVETGSGTGIWNFTCDDFSWTAVAAPFDAAKCIAIYDNTATNKDLVGYLDLGSFTLGTGGTLAVDIGANGALQTVVA